MNERQRDYFRRRLLAWREEVVKEAMQPPPYLLHELNRSDVVDRASAETDRSLELRARGRQHKLISKIDAALNRLEDGTYGFAKKLVNRLL